MLYQPDNPSGSHCTCSPGARWRCRQPVDDAELGRLKESAKITCDANKNEVYDACPKIIQETCKVRGLQIQQH